VWISNGIRAHLADVLEVLESKRRHVARSRVCGSENVVRVSDLGFFHVVATSTRWEIQIDSMGNGSVGAKRSGRSPGFCRRPTQPTQGFRQNSRQRVDKTYKQRSMSAGGVPTRQLRTRTIRILDCIIEQVVSDQDRMALPSSGCVGTGCEAGFGSSSTSFCAVHLSLSSSCCAPSRRIRWSCWRCATRLRC
jgi:hypothetical protein